MPFIPPFGSPPGGAAGATIELDNLGTTAINTSLISDTDSTDDLGSSAKQWKDLYVGGTSFLNKIERNNLNITAETSDGSDNSTIRLSGGGGENSGASRGAFVALYGNEFGFTVDGWLYLGSGNQNESLIHFSAGNLGRIMKFEDIGLYPDTDSQIDLGTSSKFWDETFTDELILTNVGAASAAADKLVLSAIDLSAGNTILDINTEGTGVTGTGTPTADRTVAIRVNGEVIYLTGSTVAN